MTPPDPSTPLGPRPGDPDGSHSDGDHSDGDHSDGDHPGESDHSDGDHPGDDHGVDATPSGLMHLRTWLDPELDEGFSTWCDGHHAEQLALPGFRRVRRFSLVASSAAEPPDYLTIYDLDRLDVLDGEAYAAHRARAAGLPAFLEGHLRAARTDAWMVATVPAREGMVPGGSGLVHLFVPEGPELAVWFAEHGLAVIDAARGSSARLLRAVTGEQIVMVELDDVPEDLDLASIPVPNEAGDLGDSGWGLYRLDHLATPDGPVVSPHRDHRGGS